MHLKVSALASHQKLFCDSLHLYRVEHSLAKAPHETNKRPVFDLQIPESKATSVWPYQRTKTVSQTTTTAVCVAPALVVIKSEHTYLRTLICIWFGRCGCIATISDIHSNLPPRDPSSGLSSRELVCIGQIVGKCCKIFQLFTHKTSCERRIAQSYIVKKISTSFHSYIAAY